MSEKLNEQAGRALQEQPAGPCAQEASHGWPVLNAKRRKLLPDGRYIIYYEFSDARSRCQ